MEDSSALPKMSLYHFKDCGFVECLTYFPVTEYVFYSFAFPEISYSAGHVFLATNQVHRLTRRGDCRKDYLKLAIFALDVLPITGNLYSYFPSQGIKF